MQKRGDGKGRLPSTQEQGPSRSLEQFVRQSLVQAAWPVALAPPPRRALTVDQQHSSASELISRRGIFSRRQYGSIEQVATTSNSGSDSLIRRYRLENGNSLGERDELFGPHNAPVLENPEFETRWYFKYFLGRMHQNYIGVDGAQEPFLLSVLQDGTTGLMRAVLYNRTGAHKIYIPPSFMASDHRSQTPIRPSVKQILNLFPSMHKIDKSPKEVPCAEMQKDILLLEEQEGSVSFKIGVVFMMAGQTTDDDMLSNEFGDEKWERFLMLLGDKIRLKGWTRFRGGLDVKGDMTGLHSVYTTHQGHEIMFHVSTMLPYSTDNRQQLERKRHIGNDIVNIIFADESAHDTFNPQNIQSQFTHVFAIVSEGLDGYMLTVFSDDMVPPFGPSLPCPPVFSDANLFRDFLLVKLMNAEKATFQTKTFAEKRVRTLDTLIKDICNEHSPDNKPMLTRRTFSDVWSSSGSGLTGAARAERFLHLGHALKLDAILRGDAPAHASSGPNNRPTRRRVPWQGHVWRSTPLPGTPVCAEQISDGKLLFSTNSNTYILEEQMTKSLFLNVLWNKWESLSSSAFFQMFESLTITHRADGHDTGTTRVILRWEGSVRAARVTRRAGLFRVANRTNASSSLSSNAGIAGVYAVPLAELCAGAWAMRPLQDCKQARLSRTKTAHFFDVVDNGSRITLAVAVGRRVLLMQEEENKSNGKGYDYVHIKDIVLGEMPKQIKYLDCVTGVLVAAFKHHWEIIDCDSSQNIKRADHAEQRRGTLVEALRIGDETDRQLLLCYNHTCHFERITSRGLESDVEYDFHWTTIPTEILNVFPYVMAFAEDLMEIRLVANGSLIHAASIPGLKLLCGRRDVFYIARVPDYNPNDHDPKPSKDQLPGSHKQTRPRQIDEDDSGASSGTASGTASGSATTSTRLDCVSASTCSTSMTSEHENIRPPLVRMPAVSPPNSPKPKPTEPGTGGANRGLHVFRIPQVNLCATRFQQQAARAVQPPPLAERPNSIRQRLAEMNIENQPRAGCSKDNNL